MTETPLPQRILIVRLSALGDVIHVLPSLSALRAALPDGKVLSFDAPVSCLDVATEISPGLAKAAIGARVDDVLCDGGRPAVYQSTAAGTKTVAASTMNHVVR